MGNILISKGCLVQFKTDFYEPPLIFLVLTDPYEWELPAGRIGGKEYIQVVDLHNSQDAFHQRSGNIEDLEVISP